MPSLQERLRTSRVGHWALAYIGGAWLMLQVVDILGDQFQWPLRLQQSITVVLVFGLLITVVLAWYHGEKGQQRFTTSELLIIGSLLVAGAGTLSVLRSPEEPVRGPPGLMSDPSSMPLTVLAVLPFENLGGDSADDHFASGIHEDILTQLSSVADLTVISRRSVLQYADSRHTIPQIAAELGTRSVMEGSVRRDGDRIRVTAQLIDAATDAHVWAQTYDLAIGDILQIQSEVARQVAAALKVTLTTSEARRIARPATVGMGSWELVQQARAVTARGGRSEAGILEEERMLRAALAMDPEYARAWALLATNFAARPWDFGLGQVWADSARTAARRAIELDPELAIGWAAFGDVYNTLGFLDGAEENFTRAVELDPNLATAQRELGRLASVRGRFDEALTYLRQALRRDPRLEGIRTELGHALAALGDIETAERWFRWEIELGNDRADSVFTVRAWAHWWAGRLDDAVSAQVRAVAEEPEGPIHVVGLAELALMNGDPAGAVVHVQDAVQRAQDKENLAFLFFATTTLGVAHLEMGDAAAARPFLEASREKLLEQVDRGVQWPMTHLELAVVEDGLGDRERALQWAQRAFDLGSRHLHLIEMNPGFDGLREDPGFRQIVSRMRAAVDRLRANVQREEGAAAMH